MKDEDRFFLEVCFSVVSVHGTKDLLESKKMLLVLRKALHEKFTSG